MGVDSGQSISSRRPTERGSPIRGAGSRRVGAKHDLICVFRREAASAAPGESGEAPGAEIPFLNRYFSRSQAPKSEPLRPSWRQVAPLGCSSCEATLRCASPPQAPRRDTGSTDRTSRCCRRRRICRRLARRGGEPVTTLHVFTPLRSHGSRRPPNVHSFADVQAPPLRLDATAASTKASPSAPSRTVGVRAA